MNFYLVLFGILLGYIHLCFLISVFKKRNDIADIAWGLGFILLAWSAYALNDISNLRALLVNSLISIWGLRLAFHIYSRHRKQGEDKRYQTLIHRSKPNFYWISYWKVYWLQGVLLLLVSTPVLLINLNPEYGFNAFDGLFLILWGLGFVLEMIADAQLAQFKKNSKNKGKIMKTGLWAYSRHPNYFGELLQWWAIGFLALAVPYGVWGLWGPALISFLILKVSGIPMLEKKMQQNPEFLEYQASTSVFFPWFKTKRH